jgi:hypothetical protein
VLDLVFVMTSVFVGVYIAVMLCAVT